MEGELKDVNDLPDKRSFVVVSGGVGGAGGNINEECARENGDSEGAVFINYNTDGPALKRNKKRCDKLRTLLLGPTVTGGYGAGMEPEVGEAAALESQKEIEETFKDADVVVLTSGGGGGTGTGAQPVIARIAKIMGKPVIGIMSRPFSFEGGERRSLAQAAIDKELAIFRNYHKKLAAGGAPPTDDERPNYDLFVTFNNEMLLDFTDADQTMEETYKFCDKKVSQVLEALIHMIVETGRNNLDVKDLIKILKDAGFGGIIVMEAEGENRAEQIIEQLEGKGMVFGNLDGDNCIYNVAGPAKGKQVKQGEFVKISNAITKKMCGNSEVNDEKQRKIYGESHYMRKDDKGVLTDEHDFIRVIMIVAKRFEFATEQPLQLPETGDNPNVFQLNRDNTGNTVKPVVVNKITAFLPGANQKKGGS